MTLEDRLVLKKPSPQNALDIFKGSWVSKIPGNYDSGQVPLFEDTRIKDCLPFLGPLNYKCVLDLGPLEGGQAYVLENLGAEVVISIEANSLMYLKCLIVKDILGMGTNFLHGDAIEYLKTTTNYFDLGVACGILYHMADPIELLWLLSQKCEQLIIWTHYYEESKNKINVFVEHTQREFLGIKYDYYRQNYGQAFDSNIYCGGVVNFSNWMTKEGILRAFYEFNYDDNQIKIVHDVDSPHGAAMLLAVRKK